MDAKDAEERVRGTLQPVKKEDCEVGLTVIQLLLKLDWLESLNNFSSMCHFI